MSGWAHGRFMGGYYPVQLGYEEARAMMRDDAAQVRRDRGLLMISASLHRTVGTFLQFESLVKASLCRHVTAVNKLVAKGMRFWDYGNAFLFESYKAGADIMAPGSDGSPDQGGKFRYPSYGEIAFD
jgi:urocanate hydratase